MQDNIAVQSQKATTAYLKSKLIYYSLHINTVQTNAQQRRYVTQCWVNVSPSSATLAQH